MQIFPKKLRLSLKTKLVLSTGILIVILVAAIGITTTNQQEVALEHEHHRRGLAIAKDLAMNSARAFVTHDVSTLRRYINNVMEQDYVKYVVIMDQNRKVVMHNRLDEVGKVYSDPESMEAVNTQAPFFKDYPSGENKGKVCDIVVPVEASGVRLGTVRLGYSHKGIENEIAYARNQLVLVASIASLLGLLLAFLISNVICRSIKQLTQATRRITRGDLTVRTEVTSEDEIGELSKSFDQMTSYLRKSREEVERHREHLEELVKERTKELERVNEKLRQDIAERKKVEKKIKQKTEDLILLNSLDNAVNEGKNLEEIVSLLSRETSKIFSSFGATVYFMSEDKKYLILRRQFVSQAYLSLIEKKVGTRIPRPEIKIPLKEGSLYKKVLEEDKPQLVNDAETIRGLMAEFTQSKALKKLIPKIHRVLGIRSVMNMPLIANGEVIGLIDISRDAPFTQLHLERFKVISEQLTAILKRKQAEKNLQQRVHELTTLSKVSRYIGSTLELDKVLILSLESALNLLNAKAGSIMLLDERREFLTVSASCGLSKEFSRAKERLGEGIAGYVAESGKPLLLKDGMKDSRFEKPKKKSKIKDALSVPIGTKDKIIGVFNVNNKKEGTFIKSDLSLFSILASEIGVAIKNARLYQDIKQGLLNTVKALAVAVDAKDPYTQGHSERVARYSSAIAKEMGLPKERIDEIEIAARLHDVGKIGVSEKILGKPAKLTNEEWEIIKEHPKTSVKILEPVAFPSKIISYVLYHHERPDGKGYPNGISRDVIPLGASIIKVADAFDAMTSARPYRPALSSDQAIKELKKNAGTQFDPEIVSTFLKVLQEVNVLVPA